MNNTQPIIEVKEITKKFPGVIALKGVSLDVRRGEVHAILGENGAGKSTLMKILSGAHIKDSGEILINGNVVEIENPTHAQQLGISMIYQEFNLAPQLSVGANIFIGREPRTKALGIIRNTEIRKSAQGLLDELDVDINVSAKVSSLNVSEQQIVEIAKALSVKARLLIMDEPTSALMESEVETLFRIVCGLKERGIGIIYISHHLEEIFSIADRITILRDGAHIKTVRKEELDQDEAVRLMVGRDIKDMYAKSPGERGRKILEVRNVYTKKLKNVSFSLHEGEVLGVSGLLGSGRTEIARTLFGADSVDSGTIILRDKSVSRWSIAQAIREGFGFVPEDRKSQGLFLSMSVIQNIAVASIPAITKGLFVKKKNEFTLADQYIKKLGIRTASGKVSLMKLSGGNQQKVVLAKWLALNPGILILDDPTRGIDVGAKQAIYKFINDLVREGMGILFISSDLTEILGVSDRILVVAEGEVRRELDRKDADEEIIMRYSTIGC